MVDAQASLRDTAPARPAQAPAAPTAGNVGWAVSFADGEAFQRYRTLAGNAAVSPSQSPHWISSWIRSASPDAIIATANRNGVRVFSIVLEIVPRGPFRVARFMSGSHACGNFAPLAEAAGDHSGLVAGLDMALRQARPDVDLLMLERMARQIGGRENPLLALSHAPSPNLALAIDLTHGFERLVSGPSGKRKRKKHRSQARKLEAAGSVRRFQAATPAEVDRVLDAFYAMKQRRLRAKGVDDVFAGPEIREFFRALFKTALDAENPPFFLQALEVGGTIRAVTGCSIEGKRLICEFGAIDDDLAFASPGDFLFFENIQEACAQGYEVYDFSVGDEPYKRLWCDLEFQQFDVFHPLTPRGRIYASYLRGKAVLQARIKASRWLWPLVQKLRSLRTVTSAAG